MIRLKARVRLWQREQRKRKIGYAYARRVRRSWSFSGLATMIRILMMYYVNYKSILEYPEKDWDLMIEEVIRPPNHLSLFD